MSLQEQTPEVTRIDLSESRYEPARYGASSGCESREIPLFAASRSGEGLVKIDSFRFSLSKLSYLDLLTLEGIEAKRQMARGYLPSKEAEYVALRAEI